MLTPFQDTHNISDAAVGPQVSDRISMFGGFVDQKNEGTVLHERFV